MATEEHDPGSGPEDRRTTAAATAEDPEPDQQGRDTDADVIGADPAETADDPGQETAGTDAEATGEAVDGEGDDDSVDGDAGYATGSIKRILEAALLVAGRPLSIKDFEKLFGGGTEAPPRNAIREALAELATDWSGRSLVLQEVASGWRAQVRTEFEPWIARLWDEKPPRYSRALLETLAIIAYRQPMTRSEIEDIRGVSVSSQIIRTLTEREWIRVVGHREAPGRPAMYGTTREFLDYFNLKTLDQLPPISDIKDLEGQYPELGFEAEPGAGDARNGSADAGEAHDPEGETASGDADSAGTSVDGADSWPAEDGEDALDDASASGVTVSDDDTAPTPDRDADGEDDDAEEPPCTPAS